MIIFFRSLRCEFLKHKHTSINLIYFLLPFLIGLLFIGYFKVSKWEYLFKLSLYLNTLCICIPFIVGIVVYIIINTENTASNFQLLLSNFVPRTISYISKLIYLIIYNVIASAISIFTFSLLIDKSINQFYITVFIVLVFSIIPLYIIHLWIGLYLGKSSTIALGLIGSLLSALMITGFGDHFWKWIPWAWSSRLLDYCILQRFDSNHHQQYTIFIIGAIAFTVLLFIANMLWFIRWEGINKFE